MKVFKSKRDSVNEVQITHILCALAIFPALACLVVSCANDPTQRRSAVDRARFCKDDPQAVFEGQCIQRGANIKGAQPPAVQDPQPPAVQDPQPPAVQDPQPPAVQDPQPPAGQDPQPPAGQDPQPPAGQDPQPPAGQDPQPPKEEPAKNRLVVFLQDSFVAIASQSVVSNCFVSKGTKIEVSGEVSPVTQFKELGVEQNIAFKVVAVTYPAAGAGACALAGKNFVYLSNHAELQEKP